ncbi:hypothetical protein TNIN_80131 [Trichonephila inaurata madagascariensis]|uniref:Uncharacterized protein n=1 Tax=Trichonephila inaurata madagascariensis TaxID=2747483 RepID=A0A8X6X765_9ARAC|nr:hypothetical protein TNIN_80131 [Trichonephila inaurata madagascariensis]
MSSLFFELCRFSTGSEGLKGWNGHGWDYARKHVRHGSREGEPGPVHGQQAFVAPVEQTQLPRLVLLLGLLAAKGHLSGHHALTLRDERALSAHAIPPAAVALVALKRRHHPVVPAASALRGALVAFCRPQEQTRGRLPGATGQGPGPRPGRGGARCGSAAVRSAWDAHRGTNDTKAATAESTNFSQLIHKRIRGRVLPSRRSRRDRVRGHAPTRPLVTKRGDVTDSTSLPLVVRLLQFPLGGCDYASRWHIPTLIQIPYAR